MTGDNHIELQNKIQRVENANGNYINYKVSSMHRHTANQKKITKKTKQ